MTEQNLTLLFSYMYVSVNMNKNIWSQSFVYFEKGEKKVSLKLKDADPVQRMKDMQEELKNPSLGEFGDLEQDPYVIETTRTTPIEKLVYQPHGKLTSSSDGNPYIMTEEQ